MYREEFQICLDINGCDKRGGAVLVGLLIKV